MRLQRLWLSDSAVLFFSKRTRPAKYVWDFKLNVFRRRRSFNWRPIFCRWNCRSSSHWTYPRWCILVSQRLSSVRMRDIRAIRFKLWWRNKCRRSWGFSPELGRMSRRNFRLPGRRELWFPYRRTRSWAHTYRMGMKNLKAERLVNFFYWIEIYFFFSMAPKASAMVFKPSCALPQSLIFSELKRCVFCVSA